MKRKIQPLQLSRETLRQLDNDKLAGVGGGIFTDTITTIFSVVVSCPQ
ncbi:MAG: hypothetical protein ACJ76N_16170 [Thermoanaerobaculia bacterium]